MRGKPYFAFIESGDAGLIPAHAGKTHSRRTRNHRPKAHPRACGENPTCRLSLDNSRGSSPRMRGKHEVSGTALTAAGLIPAHAGKTCPRGRRRVSASAHPRACGENSCDGVSVVHEAGSSPRMRGKLFNTVYRTGYGGLIPAHAGKTKASKSHIMKRTAHPRACGENGCGCDELFGSAGSSPRMRGKHDYEGSGLYSMGLIPAHAGKTTRRSR